MSEIFAICSSTLGGANVYSIQIPEVVMCWFPLMYISNATCESPCNPVDKQRIWPLVTEPAPEPCRYSVQLGPTENDTHLE